MTRPFDGLCAKCKRQLLPEATRTDLTRGTDMCGKCAYKKLESLWNTTAYRRWLRVWEDKLESLLRINGKGRRPT